MRVAAGQAEAVVGDIGANVATAVELLTEAAGRGARLLVLPEAFLTAYDERVFAAGDLPRPGDLPGLLEPLSAAAWAVEATVVLSTPVRRADRTTMTMVVIRPDGSTSTPYDKQHIPSDESDWFTPGDHPGAVSVAGRELGLAICYDTAVPEHARLAAVAGATAYLVSSAYFPDDEIKRDTRLSARARENAMWVVAACATGPGFVGGTAIWSPAGDPVAQLGAERGVVVADLL